MNSTQL